jgi:protein phosphatase
VDTQTTAAPPTQLPVMAGAAQAGPPEQLRSAARQNSPAGRAGLLRRTAPQVALSDDADTADWDMPSTGRHAASNGSHEDDFDEPAAARRGPVPGHPDDDYGERTRHGGRRRVPIVTSILVLLILLVTGGLYGSWRYVQGQYYLGVDQGNMAIFRGVNTSVAGMSLHSPYQRSNVPVGQLPASAQLALSQTISAKGLSDAQAMVAQVQTVLADCRTQWQKLSAWKKANDAYQVQRTAWNAALAHLRRGQKPPPAPTSPGQQPSTPEAATCGPANAFGIASTDLPPGTSGAGSVSPTTPGSLPTASPASKSASPSGSSPTSAHPTTS